MLRVPMLQGSRVVELPDYAFTPEHIDVLERLSLLCPNHPVRIKEQDGRTHVVPLSALLIDRQGVLKLNTMVVP